MMRYHKQTCSSVDGDLEDVPVMLMTGKVVSGAVLMPRSPGALGGPTPAQAGPLVAWDPLGVRPRRRGAGTSQSLARRSSIGCGGGRNHVCRTAFDAAWVL